MAAVYDFIVVGSGAGGGPLACNLALHPNGYRVALLEAGTDPAERPDSPTFYNTSVPALHTRATEDPTISWEFFVQHYPDKERQAKAYDSKYNEEQGGVFYPRAAAVGGCTSHHAMITLYPHRDDWLRMQQKWIDVDSDSWSPDKMRGYFERLEDCQYLPRPGPTQTADPATRHGFAGWLPLSMADPTVAFKDKRLLEILLHAFLVAEIDANQPADKRAPADLKAVLADPQKTADALKLAVGRLLKAGETAAQRLPNSARETLDMLKPGIEALLRKPHEPGGKKPANVAALLGAYVRDVPGLLQLFQLALAWLDPNRNFASDAERVGAFSAPASTLHGVRTGVRERILGTQGLYPDRLHLITGALVTQVLIKDKQAVGVRYLKKEGLYEATPKERRSDKPPSPREIYVRPHGEVILAGGTFNTPQLLMLSGVGPAAHLKDKGIEVVCDLPGVGENLQDRYEVAVITELPKSDDFKGFTVLEGSTFHAPGDACAKEKQARPDQAPGPDAGLKEWANHRGVYASNGVALTIIKASAQAENQVPDLFIFGLPGYFKGYYSGYSSDTQSEVRDGKWEENHRRFTWAILKGRTRNRCGTVRLAGASPFQRPAINFMYFDKGSKDWEKDRDALVEAVRFVELLVAGPMKADPMAAGPTTAKIFWPPEEVRNDNKSLGEFIVKEAWGHHACGTCRIGKADDKQAVLDGDFRVRGVKNLRVVDASVFPEIPGFFIIMSIYMISEKASDVILQDRQLADAGKSRDWPLAPAQ
jgi:choline dehydrogenase